MSCCPAGEILERVNAAMAAIGVGMEDGVSTSIMSDVGAQPLVVHLGISSHVVDHLVADIVGSFVSVIERDSELTNAHLRGLVAQSMLAGAFAKDGAA